MDTVFEIIGWLSIPLTLLSVIYMVVTWRRQRRLSSRSLWVPILVSAVALLVYVGLIGLDPSPVTTWLPFLVAVGVGVFIGHGTPVEFVDGAAVAARNPWSFLVWAGSFTATQLVALLAPGSTEAMLSLLFAATGLTVGEQLALVSTRSNVLGAARRAATAAAAVFVVAVAFGAIMSPRTGRAAEVDLTLGEVAGMTMNDGFETDPRAGVKVDITGTPEGTYSGPSIDVTIANDTADTLRIRVPVGTKLYPANVATQTMLTAGNEVIVVPPGQVVTKRIQAYCGEPHDGVPTTADTFTVGETETGPTQRTLEAITEHQDEILDPSSGLTTFDAQRIVWMRRVPEEYEPLDESDPAYKLYDPEPTGPTSEQSGKAGGSAGGVALVGAAGTARSANGNKRRDDAGTKPKPKAGSYEEFSKLMDEYLDDETGAKSDPKPETKPETKSKSESGAEPVPEKPAPEKPAQEDEHSGGGAGPDSQTQADKQLTVGPLSHVPGTKKVTYQSGDTKLSYDKATKTGTAENEKFTASYDDTNNRGRLRKKDGSATIDTHRGGGEGEFKGKNKTTTIKASRDGTTKTVHYLQKRKGGGTTEAYVKLTPAGNDLSYENGPDKVTVKTRAGSASVRHEHPGGHAEVRHGQGGTSLSYQQRLRDKFERTKVTVGFEYDSGLTKPSLEVQHDFDLRINRRLRVPMTATVRGVGGPGSNVVTTVGVRTSIGRRRRR